LSLIIPVMSLWNASSTLIAYAAEVSMNARLLSSANFAASSVLTSL